MRGLLIALLLLIPQLAHAQTQTEPFGLQSTNNKIWQVQWNRAVREIEASRQDTVQLALIAGIPETTPERAEWINDKVNSLIRQVPTADKRPWPSPQMIFTYRKGDCLERALAKVALLRTAGFPATDIRLVIGVRRGEFHAEIAVRSGRGWLLLDNIYGGKILADVIVPSFAPQYVLKVEVSPVVPTGS